MSHYKCKQIKIQCILLKENVTEIFQYLTFIMNGFNVFLGKC